MYLPAGPLGFAGGELDVVCEPADFKHLAVVLMLFITVRIHVRHVSYIPLHMTGSVLQIEI